MTTKDKRKKLKCKHEFRIYDDQVKMFAYCIHCLGIKQLDPKKQIK